MGARLNCEASNFNPRSREGSDNQYIIVSKITAISIHAPVKGATSLLVDGLHL